MKNFKVFSTKQSEIALVSCVVNSSEFLNRSTVKEVSDLNELPEISLKKTKIKSLFVFCYRIERENLETLKKDTGLSNIRGVIYVSWSKGHVINSPRPSTSIERISEQLVLI